MAVLSKGMHYAKLGDVILESQSIENFRISMEINRIPSFEFEISNCSANRTAIANGITNDFKIYWQHGGSDTLIFTGVINADGIEYVSLDSIMITGFASYVKLAWPFHKHLADEDAEAANTVLAYNGAYTDYTTQANNDTINDVPVYFDSTSHKLYVGDNQPFWGLQIKYSTKGIRPGDSIFHCRYYDGESWELLDVLDESDGFTNDPGTYDIIIPHPPSDWSMTTINSKKKYWMSFQVGEAAYTTQPAIDRIHIVNVDIFRTYYFDTSARAILLNVLTNTEYTMDATDACPEDLISIVAEYESPLRIVAAIANALAWTDVDGSKKAYQWWITEDKKVHMKQKRGTTYADDITGDLTIFNNHEDYFHLSNRLIGFGPRDGLSQIRAIVQDRVSITSHGLREIALPKEQVGKYLMLRDSLEKDIAISKNPMRRIKGSVTTEFWGQKGYNVGDTITLHQDAWNVSETAMQIVKAEITPMRTTINMGISQEHLDGLKNEMQRQLDLNNVMMHGSTTLFEAGPETMNYQRVDATEVYSAKLKIEIPSEVVKIHKVLLSWTMGNFVAAVTSDGSAIPPHSHTGFVGDGGAFDAGTVTTGGAFTPAVGDDGGFTPSMLGEAHNHLTETSIQIVATKTTFFACSSNTVDGAGHDHTKGRTSGPDDTTWALGGEDDDVTWGTNCTTGKCVDGFTTRRFAEDTHWHMNTEGGSPMTTGETTPGITLKGTADAKYMSGLNLYAFSVTSDDESVDGHVHTGVAEGDHGHVGVAHDGHSDHGVPAQPAHSDHAIVADPGGPIDIDYGVHEEAGGTTMELLINSEKVGEYATAQTELRIDGYLATGTNSVEIRPIVGANTKGGVTQGASGMLFIEPKKF